VRWKVAGAGKRGGVRVIYYNRLQDGDDLACLVMYAKNDRDSISAEVLRNIREDDRWLR